MVLSRIIKVTFSLSIRLIIVYPKVEPITKDNLGGFDISQPL